MDTFEAIRKRRSVRQYTGEPIPREALIKIVEAGRWAPSGYNRQPWDFILVTEKAMINELKIAARWMQNAGAIIAVVLDPEASKFWLEDGSAAIENILLASTALGYGSCWLEGWTLRHEDDFKALLHVPADKRLWSRQVPSSSGSESPDLFVIGGVVWRGMVPVNDELQPIGKSEDAMALGFDLHGAQRLGPRRYRAIPRPPRRLPKSATLAILPALWPPGTATNSTITRSGTSPI